MWYFLDDVVVDAVMFAKGSLSKADISNMFTHLQSWYLEAWKQSAITHIFYSCIFKKGHSEWMSDSSDFKKPLTLAPSRITQKKSLWFEWTSFLMLPDVQKKASV